PVLNACYGSNAQQDRQNCITVRSSVAHCNPAGLAYHPESAEACVNSHQAAYSDANITKDEVTDLTKSCLPALNNGKNQGATCSADTECNAGAELRCVIRLGQMSGVCTKPTIVEGGQTCLSQDQVCKEGFFCSKDNYC